MNLFTLKSDPLTVLFDEKIGWAARGIYVFMEFKSKSGEVAHAKVPFEKEFSPEDLSVIDELIDSGYVEKGVAQ